LWIKLPNEFAIDCKSDPAVLIELSLEGILLLLSSIQTFGEIESHNTSKLGFVRLAGREEIQV
jgi:hypothetical protein